MPVRARIGDRYSGSGWASTWIFLTEDRCRFVRQLASLYHAQLPHRPPKAAAKLHAPSSERVAPWTEPVESSVRVTEEQQRDLAPNRSFYDMAHRSRHLLSQVRQAVRACQKRSWLHGDRPRYGPVPGLGANEICPKCRCLLPTASPAEFASAGLARFANGASMPL